MNFAVSSSAMPAAEEVILSLDAATGASVQGALNTSGSCTIGGQLVVQGTNVLDALANAEAAASTVVTISSVTGLETALANKQSTLGPTVSVQLASLTCSLIKAAAARQSLNLSDAGGTVLLGLAPNAATFLRAVSMPSLDDSGSILCSGTALFASPLCMSQDRT